MIIHYINEALRRARYEKIEDKEPYYVEISELPGVWATGRTIEECREHLAETIEDWVLFSIAKGLPIPPIGEATIRVLDESQADGSARFRGGSLP
jgi:predicted RNase H-like HicB family nuclease